MTIRYLSLLFILAFRVFAADTESLDEYLVRMQQIGKPAVLVVGCGHRYPCGFGGTHEHKDMWCVDSNNIAHNRRTHFLSRLLFGELIANCENFVKNVGANEELDITGPTNDRYVNKFDEVFLELITSRTLAHPRTLLNAARYLKTGGHLYIEADWGYEHPAYDASFNPFKGNIFKESTLTSVKLILEHCGFINLHHFDENTCFYYNSRFGKLKLMAEKSARCDTLDWEEKIESFNRLQEE